MTIYQISSLYALSVLRACKMFSFSIDNGWRNATEESNATKNRAKVPQQVHQRILDTAFNAGEILRGKLVELKYSHGVTRSMIRLLFPRKAVRSEREYIIALLTVLFGVEMTKRHFFSRENFYSGEMALQPLPGPISSNVESVIEYCRPTIITFSLNM